MFLSSCPAREHTSHSGHCVETPWWPDMRTSSYWVSFLSLSLLYGLLVFPTELNWLSRDDMLRVVDSPGSFLGRAQLSLDSALYMEAARGVSIAGVVEYLSGLGSLRFGLFSNLSLLAILILTIA